MWRDFSTHNPKPVTRNPQCAYEKNNRKNPVSDWNRMHPAAFLCGGILAGIHLAEENGDADDLQGN